MARVEPDTSFDATLYAVFSAGPSPQVAGEIDRRVTAALAGRAPAATLRRPRRMLAPSAAMIAAALATLVAGAVLVAAVVLNAEDQRVYDLTACMRERGWDVADPDTSRGEGHVVPGFSTIIDETRQPAFNADLEACAIEAGIPLEY